MKTCHSSSLRKAHAILRGDAGSVLVEAAFSLPLLIALLFGILIYGNWFMTAHSLQQAANNAARSAVAGLNTAERRTLVDQSVAASSASFPSVNGQAVSINTIENSGYYTVTLSYALSSMPLFAASPFPLPAATLQRSAVVRIDAR